MFRPGRIQLIVAQMRTMHAVEAIGRAAGGSSLSVRCYAELNDHLPEAYRGRTIRVPLTPSSTVGDVLLSLGIPESEVDVALMNGISTPLSALVSDGARLSVYPVFESFDVADLTTIHGEPLRRPRFILDVHLGKLASYMRMMGYDAMYQSGYNDDELVSISIHEGRTLLSKDRPLIAHPLLTRAYLVRSIQPKEQLVEVLGRFDLLRLARPFQRCMECNTLLHSVSKEEAMESLPPLVREHVAEFNRCSSCNKIYWRGSHYERMRKFIDDVVVEVSALLGPA